MTEGTLGANIIELVDVDALREEIKKKYREVADTPTTEFHFHTGRQHALRMGYPESPLDQLSEEATEAFAGVANPFYWGCRKQGSTSWTLARGPAWTASSPRSLWDPKVE